MSYILFNYDFLMSIYGDFLLTK